MLMLRVLWPYRLKHFPFIDKNEEGVQNRVFYYVLVAVVKSLEKITEQESLGAMKFSDFKTQSFSHERALILPSFASPMRLS